MSTSIKSFSCDLFWLTVNETHMSLGTEQLPSDVHVTISYHPNDEFINLHLTRNGKDIDPSNKPKIAIVKINKKELEDLFPFIAKRMLSIVLRRVDDGEFKKQFRRLIFIHGNAKRNKNYPAVEKRTINVFKKISKLTRHKTKIEIKGDIDTVFERIEDIEAFHNWAFPRLQMIARLQKKYSSGVIAIADESTQFLKINRNWYQLNNPSFRDILFAILPLHVVKSILSHYENALEKIQLCNTYDESKEYDKPIVL
jgi:hypothetical protein